MLYGKIIVKYLQRRFLLTLEEIAEKIGVSKMAVSLWSRGVNNPSLKTLRKICEIFNITLEDIDKWAEENQKEKK